MFNHELDFTHDMLDNLIEKGRLLLEENKQPLLQVLRWRDGGWFVPEEIQEKVKTHIKDFSTVSPLEGVSILPRTSSWQEYGSHWKIVYKGKTYEDLWWSGNTYNHIITQQQQIEERTLQDMDAGLLTSKERKIILALNYIHDIAERHKGDIVQTKKTDQARQEEYQLTHSIIDEQQWTNQEKLSMKYIFSKDHKKSLFKLYETMFYIIDIKHFIKYKENYNNIEPLVALTLSLQIPKFLKEFELLNNNIISPLQIASFRKHLITYKDIIDEAFLFSENTVKDEPEYLGYLEAKNIWNDLLLPKLYS